MINGKNGKQMTFGEQRIWVPRRVDYLQKIPEETKIRKCLKCQYPFMSYSKCHRLCDFCHATNGYEYQPYIVILKGTKVERRF